MQEQDQIESGELHHKDDLERTGSTGPNRSTPIVLSYATDSHLPTKVGLFAYLMTLAEGIAFLVGAAFELRARSWPADSVYADGNYGLEALCNAVGLLFAAIATITLGIKIYRKGVHRSRSCLLVMLACVGMALVVFTRGLIQLSTSGFG